jgi:hypothetical protein
VITFGPRTAIAFLILATTGAARAAAEAEITADTIVRRMDEARAESRARLRPFEVTRTYQLFGKENSRTQAEVSAVISYAPAGIQHYTIYKLFGASIGETLVRKILEGESEVLSNRDASDISGENYIFHLIRTETLNGRACYLLGLHPRRRDGKLIVGTAWVDAATYLIRKVEGEALQTASWWVHNVHVTLEFQDVQGMWLQTALFSTADVRLLGPHAMVSHDVDYRIGEITASARKPVR